MAIKLARHLYVPFKRCWKREDDAQKAWLCSLSACDPGKLVNPCWASGFLQKISSNTLQKMATNPQVWAWKSYRKEECLKPPTLLTLLQEMENCALLMKGQDWKETSGLLQWLATMRRRATDQFEACYQRLPQKHLPLGLWTWTCLYHLAGPARPPLS